jgi:hypothetical protein
LLFARHPRVEIYWDNVLRGEKIRREQREAGLEISKINLDVRMGAMKPLVTSGMIDGIKFFQSPPGKALILKGVEKSSLSRCYDPAYIQMVLAWSATSQADLNPVFEPAEIAPPGAGFDDYIAYVNVDEEDLDEALMDLVDSDDDI